MKTIEQITLEVETGDQSWRSDIGPRYATYLRNAANEMERRLTDSTPDKAGVEYAIKKNREGAAQVDAGTLSFNPATIEIALRMQAQQDEG